MRNGVVRTVRGGRVRIGGVYYRPQKQHLDYEGRLDGLRLLFGRYPAPWKPGGYEPFVFLWGTAAAAEDWPGPDCMGGAFPWAFWERES